MRRRHLRVVLRIEEQASPRPWSLSLFLSELRYTESRAYLVARVGTEIVGYAGLMLVAGDGHVTNVGVDPDHRRQGIATRLLLQLVRRALAAGAEARPPAVRGSNTAPPAPNPPHAFGPPGTPTNHNTP